MTLGVEMLQKTKRREVSKGDGQMGDRIKTLRERYGLSQKDLARTAQVAQADISRCEGGVVSELRASAVARIATALHTTSDHLIIGKTVPAEVLLEDERTRRHVEQLGRLNYADRRKLDSFLAFLSAESSRRSGKGAAADEGGEEDVPRRKGSA